MTSEDRGSGDSNFDLQLLSQYSSLCFYLNRPAPEILRYTVHVAVTKEKGKEGEGEREGGEREGGGRERGGRERERGRERGRGREREREREREF